MASRLPRCEGPRDLMDFDLSMAAPAVTHEVSQPSKLNEEERQHEQNPTCSWLVKDLVSTCDGSRRDPESRCDFWEGNARHVSERRAMRSVTKLRPCAWLQIVKEKEEQVSSSMDKVLVEVTALHLEGGTASPCHVEEAEQVDVARLRREAERLTNEVEAKAEQALREQESNALHREAERVVDELEAKAKETLREKQKEQVTAARIRQEAEQAEMCESTKREADERARAEEKEAGFAPPWGIQQA
eukprot:Skav224485  [mRNA]  locus=scaffold2179:46559:57281:+ [translate_table: standard]